MTHPDELPCPECDGAGEHSIGRLRLQCRFCLGAGTVDGPDDAHGKHGEQGEGPRYREDGWKIPEEGEQYNPEIHGPLPPVGSHPAVSESQLCPTCLGSRVVASATLAEAPCPVCTAKRQ